MSDSIFKSTTTTLAKVMSGELIPATGLLDAKKCGPGHLIVKKNKKWFWQRETITPTAFKLSDILRHEDVDMKLEPFHLPPINSEDIGKFNLSHNFVAKGNFEASVPQGYVDVDLGCGNSVTISFDLGDIVDNSLDVPSLVNAANNRKIDPSHALVREAMSDSRNSLCLVVTSLNNKTEVDVKTINKVEVDGDAGVGVGGAKMVMLSEGTRCLQIPANTAMAFRMHDLLIRADQTMQFLLLPGSEGGFEKMKLTGGHDIKTYLEAEGKEVPGREFSNEITEGMEAIFDLPDDGLSVIRKSLIELMTTPLDKLNELLQSAVNHLIVGDESSKVSCAALDEMLGGVSVNAHKDLLRVAGFVFGEVEVMYPGSDKDGVLNCLADLLDVMADLSEDQRDKLLQCTETERSALMEMLAKSMSVDRLPLDQTRVTGLTEEFPHVESLLVSVGFNRERMDEKWYLCQGSQQTGGESVTPGEMLAVIYALWGQ
ncbi:LOW QUALITY PROTEIN: gasdermin-E-like [Diadema setosum]|uniref:LOW QUALITY PROTEIN: gasdermin-E-like n=1 Tax=Diadema setosum TaxID=31175 RepID=UPI003B3BCD7F